jgi:hypothetical protein
MQQQQRCLKCGVFLGKSAQGLCEACRKQLSGKGDKK